MTEDANSSESPATLVCYRCGETAKFPERKRCECGEPFWFDIDTSGFDWPVSDQRSRPGSQSESSATFVRGVWRYTDLLPVSPVGGVAAAAGDTPLVRETGLDDYAGCRIWLKDESENPTGSFKDRGSAVGVGWAADAGREWVGTVSHGNMAMSVAATAAGGSNGGHPQAIVLVPDDVSTERLTAIAQYDPTVLRIAGDYGDLYYETLAADTAIEFVNSDTPLRVAGQKTTMLEICDAFASGRPSGDASGRKRLGVDPSKLGADQRDREERPDPALPEAVVLPVSSGGHASASWKALLEIRAAGLLTDENLPRLYFVQAAACDPIAQAYREEADEVTAIDGGETVAYSIANADPPSGTRALTAARETGGAVVSVSDEEILDAKAKLAQNAGFCVEPASATTLAGIRKLTESGELGREESAVAVLTGTGFRELDEHDSNPETVALEDVPERLRGLTN